MIDSGKSPGEAVELEASLPVGGKAPDELALLHRSGKARYWVIVTVGLVWTLWQLLIAATVPPPPVVMRSTHLAFAFVIAFLSVGIGKEERRGRWRLALDFTLVALSLAVFGHLFLNFRTIDYARLTDPLTLDLTLGWICLAIILLGTKRTTGWPIAAMAAAFLAYTFLGDLLPEPVGHSGFRVSRTIGFFYMRLEGVLGSVVGASATLIYPVVIFGAVLLSFGGGDFFARLATACLGGVRGGSAKMAVLASGLFATITGSGASNVAGTGVFTIPLMKREGYKPAMAAAIESAASVGGQILPPVMGASAFIMAELLGISYGEIILRALVPGLMYFLALFLAADAQAAKRKLTPIARSDIPRERPWAVVQDGWHYLLSLAVFLVAVGYLQWSVGRSAFYATVTLIAIDLVRRLVGGRELELRRLINAMLYGNRSAALIATAVAAVQLIISSVGYTGVGVKLSSLLVQIAGGNLHILLVVAMIASILLGTGLPTTPTYLVLAVLTAPALTEFGVPLIAAHLFVFYFGVWSDLTPPTALTPTIAAGLAHAPLLRTMAESMRVSAVGFLLPFMFVYSPELLLIGSPVPITLTILAALVALIAFVGGTFGYLFAPCAPWVRVALVGSAVLIGLPLGGALTAAGLVLAIALAVLQRLRRDRPTAAVPVAEGAA